MQSSIFSRSPAVSIGYWLLTFGLFFAQSAAALTVNDPYFREQWYLEKIQMPAAWDITTGSREVVVAVLDTGVDLDHPDLAGNLWMNQRELSDGVDNDGNGFVDDIRGWNFVEDNNRPEPTTMGGSTEAGLVHGTIVAGIIAAVGNNSEGVAGIGWQTTIMPIRVLDSRGDGQSEDIVAGIDYAVRNGAQIINLSFTTPTDLLSLSRAIERAKNAGVLVVAAAGNDNGANLDTRPVYPACTDGPAGENWVIGVAAVDRFDRKSAFSNYGSLCVDVSAPGEDVFGTQLVSSGTEAYGGYWSGTSVAAPMVAGVAALVRAIHPQVSRLELIDILKKTAVPIDALNPNYRGGLGRGRVDAAAAVARAEGLRGQMSTSVFVATAESGTPRVWIFDRNGTLVNTFLAYATTFTGGVRVATGDVDGDGAAEIITGAGPGGGPHIRVFSENGQVKSQFFAFATTFRGGVTVAAADLDSDRIAEIIVAAGRGSSPTVKVFDQSGALKSQFLAYAPSFTGGVEVTTGDVDGDGAAEIITGAGPGGGPHVRVFDKIGNVKGQFFAFETSYRGGVRLAARDTDADAKAEIIAVRGAADSSEVRLFSIAGALRNAFTTFIPSRTVLAPAGTDLNRDGRGEVVAAAGGTSPELRVFTPLGVLESAFALPAELKAGLRLATF